MKDSFQNTLLKINDLNRKYDKLISDILWQESVNHDKAIEHAIAMIPKLLFEIFSIFDSDHSAKDSNLLDLRNGFCFCINYSSLLYPNNRFHLHIKQNEKDIELKTFCFKEENVDDRQPEQENFLNWYNIESPFVRLLDLFYDNLGEAKNEFSMNRFFAEMIDNNLSGKDIWCWELDQKDYLGTSSDNKIEEYLQNMTYKNKDHDYTNYSAFLAAAAHSENLIKDSDNLDSYTEWKDSEYKKEYKNLYDNLPYNEKRFRQYNIPILGFREEQSVKKPSRKVIGNLMIPSLIAIDQHILSVFYEKTESFLNKISQYEKIIWGKANSVRAAIAQVMARNMSHNFGSHVLSNLVGDKVYENLKDEIVEKDLQKFTSLCDVDVFKDKTTKNHQLQYFFQYLKSRMDYLSEVTFGVPNLLTTKMIYGDVMKELDQVRILLNYISGVSDFKYEFILKYKDEKLNSQNDIGVAFPSDILGCHAFYNIIENIIRNTAKHAGKTNRTKTITFTINFKDIEGVAGAEDSDELYCVEIDNGVREGHIDDIIMGKKDENGSEIKGLIDLLNDSVLDEHNKLRSHSLGLLEMEASAAFLRQIDLPEIESDNYTVAKDNNCYYQLSKNDKRRLNIIKPFKTEDDHLGYRFFMQKPKEFLFVGNKWYVDDAKKKELLNIGIQFISEKDFIKAMNLERSFAHQFLLYDKMVSDAVKHLLECTNDCRTLLPLRKLPLNDEDWETLSGFWSCLKSDTYINGETRKDGASKNKKILHQLKDWAWKKYAGNIKDGLTANDISIKGERQKSAKYQVVFLDHGASYDKDKEWKKVCNNKDEKGNSYPSIEEGWIENMSSKTNGKLPLFEVLSKEGVAEKAIQNYIGNLGVRKKENEYIRIELFEAYHNKVVVIDERVQKFAAENHEGSGSTISCMNLHESTNVFVPKLPQDISSVESKESEMIPLDPNDFGKYTVKLEKYIERNIEDSFLLIHYGILERMYGRNEKNITAKLEEWSALSKRVVVTSGRGAHSLNLPKSVCFANLSSVIYVFNENRNKYIINYLLNQSRRKRNE